MCILADAGPGPDVVGDGITELDVANLAAAAVLRLTSQHLSKLRLAGLVAGNPRRPVWWRAPATAAGSSTGRGAGMCGTCCGRRFMPTTRSAGEPITTRRRAARKRIRSLPCVVPHFQPVVNESVAAAEMQGVSK